MISYGPFQAEHFYDLHLQPAQRDIASFMTPHVLVKLERQRSNTIFDGAQPILCGGVLENWSDSGLLWSFVGAGVSRSTMLAVHRLTMAFIESLTYTRLEMHVAVGFEAGHRWAKLLGFECEAPCMKAFSQGRDMALYARIRRG